MEKIYTPSQFANMINVTVKTLQRWDRKKYSHSSSYYNK